MPFASKPTNGPAGYKLFARGLVPSGGGSVTNGINVSSVAAQSAGTCNVTLGSAAPAGAVVNVTAQDGWVVGSGSLTGATLTATTLYVGVSPFIGNNAKFYFEVWAP